jgi:hypothetical protein
VTVSTEAPARGPGGLWTPETAPKSPGRAGKPNRVNQIVREAFERALAGRIDLEQWYVDLFTARDAPTMAVAARVLSIFGPPKQINVDVGVRLEDVLAAAHDRRVARLKAIDEKTTVIEVKALPPAESAPCPIPSSNSLPPAPSPDASSGR